MIYEQQVQKEIMNWLTLNKWFVWKQDSVGIYDPTKKLYRKSKKKGKSDLIAIKNGVVLFIEVKSKTGIQTDSQIEFEQDIKSHGGHYVLARGFDDIQKYLMENGVTT